MKMKISYLFDKYVSKENNTVFRSIVWMNRIAVVIVLCCLILILMKIK